MSSKRYPSRFESRAGFFASTREECLSPRVRLECNPEIPVAPGDGNSEKKNSCRPGFGKNGELFFSRTDFISLLFFIRRAERFNGSCKGKPSEGIARAV